MTILYKLTDEQGRTRSDEANETQWGPNVTHTAVGEDDDDLCSDGWIHAYLSPELAVLLNPVHAEFANPRLWEAEGEIGAAEGQLKVGCKTLTTVRELLLPEVTTEQRVKFAVLCAKAVYRERKWVAWANAWLSGKDRSADAAALAMSRARASRSKTAFPAQKAAQAAGAAAANANDAATVDAGFATLSAVYRGNIDIIALANEALAR
jgi:hypothetical protein